MIWARKTSLFSLAVLSGLVYFLSGCIHKKAEVSVADYIIKHRLTTNKDSAIIRKVFDTLLVNMQLNGSKQLDRLYNPDLINIFLIDGSLSFVKEDEQLSKLVGNCSYAGSNIIFFTMN